MAKLLSKFSLIAWLLLVVMLNVRTAPLLETLILPLWPLLLSIALLRLVARVEAVELLVK